MPDVNDVSDTIVAKSDQLNADDLMAGPITVKITKVTRGNADQPLSVHITGHQPWKPCKTMRRVLVAAWGPDAKLWVGRSVRLFRDETVQWASKDVGGVRISHVSDIESEMKLNLTKTRGKKKAHLIKPLRVQAVSLEKVLADAGVTDEQFDRWRVTNNKRLLADLDGPQRAQLGTWLNANPHHFDTMRAAAQEDAP